MLVLTRKQNERIKIGDDIVVSVLKIKGNTVRLGIA
ncbi:MAG: carbon storage regulator, partial [Planctomycetota bacterium]|nr:carbon storage regulator [Planctomycetota bacterium]